MGLMGQSLTRWSASSTLAGVSALPGVLPGVRSYASWTVAWLLRIGMATAYGTTSCIFVLQDHLSRAWQVHMLVVLGIDSDDKPEGAGDTRDAPVPLARSDYHSGKFMLFFDVAWHAGRPCVRHSNAEPSHLRDPLGTQPLLERGFTICVFIVGAVFFSVIYGNIAQAIQSLYAAGLRYRQRVEELGEFARFHRLSPSLRASTRLQTPHCHLLPCL